MRIPQKPPRRSITIHAKALAKEDLPAVQQFLQEVNKNYLHWDKVRLYPLPEGLDPLEAWTLVQARRSNKQDIPLTFQGKQHLFFVLMAKHLEWLQRIDRQAGSSGRIFGSFPDDNDRFLVNSLMEEAIASSQLEGASTTRVVAKEMLRTKRAPRDKAEQMIANNYTTILRIRELKGQDLTPEMLCHLQELITRNTLDSPEHAGRFRNADELVQVVDARTGDVIYDPPDAHELGQRVDQICSFANADSDPFVHPVIKSIALHFAMGFVHPFVEGNGRTARAIFYWFMLKEGYRAFEYLPISRILIGAPIKYARAYLYTETDDGDLTYFIHFQLKTILAAIASLYKYLETDTKLRQKAADLIETHPELNYRQAQTVRSLLDHPGVAFSIPAYAGKFRVTYPTAKSDVDGLLKAGFIERIQRGRAAHFRAVANLAKSIAKDKKQQSGGS